MKATPYTYTTPKWEYNQQTRRREKIGMEERTVEAASMFDVNKAIMLIMKSHLCFPSFYERSEKLWLISRRTFLH